MNSNLAKLRALCFWAPVVISLFTEVSTVPWERCQTVTHLLYKPSATCSSTIVLYNLEVLFFTVSLLNLHWVHRAESLVPTLAWTFHTLLPRALLNLYVSHFFSYLLQLSQILERDLSVLVVCSSVTFRRHSCHWGKKHRARSLSCKESHSLMICSP